MPPPFNPQPKPTKSGHTPTTPCPCGSGQPYAACCGRWHAGRVKADHAPTPEALMRSRYSAYVVGDLDYLLFTWHPSTAPGDLEIGPIKWLDLTVLHAAESADAGVVEFIARCKVGGRADKVHELSRFVREGGRWLYVDGVMQGKAG